MRGVSYDADSLATSRSVVAASRWPLCWVERLVNDEEESAHRGAHSRGEQPLEWCPCRFLAFDGQKRPSRPLSERRKHCPTLVLPHNSEFGNGACRP
eukprot:scaffold46160_cov42-Cyclotella_meneghiniana.AAC.4